MPKKLEEAALGQDDVVRLGRKFRDDLPPPRVRESVRRPRLELSIVLPVGIHHVDDYGSGRVRRLQPSPQRRCEPGRPWHHKGASGLDEVANHVGNDECGVSVEQLRVHGRTLSPNYRYPQAEAHRHKELPHLGPKEEAARWPYPCASESENECFPRPGVGVEFALITMFATLTAAGAHLRCYLPFTPVPVTGQVFCVLLAGAVLGARRGLLCQIEYLAAGAAGLPVFTNGGGLPALLFSTNTGYLLAFPAAAYLAGLGAEQLRSRRLSGALLGSLAGVVVIYACGAGWLAMTYLKGKSLATVLALGVYPFIGVDAVKAALVASAAAGVRRRLPG